MNIELYNRYLNGVGKMNEMHPNWVTQPINHFIADYIPGANTTYLTCLKELLQPTFWTLYSVNKILNLSQIQEKIRFETNSPKRYSDDVLNFVIKIVSDILEVDGSPAIEKLEELLILDHAVPFIPPKAYIGENVPKHLLDIYIQALYGDKNACTYLSNCFKYGKDVDIDENKASYWEEKVRKLEKEKLDSKEISVSNAIEYCKQRIPKNNNPNNNGVTEKLIQIIYPKKNSEEHRDPNALFTLAESYFSQKNNTEKNYEKAFEFYSDAANLGSIAAQYKLGMCYEYGYGVAQNHENAVDWYTKAANKGHPEARHKLGLDTINNVKQSVPKNNNPANNGTVKNAISTSIKKSTEDHRDPSALFALAESYFSQKDNTGKNYEKAFEYYNDAANLGSIAAQYKLGVCYENGYGIAQSPEKAVKWYTKAANKGYALAQNNLAICYDEGTGVPQNDKKAAEWYTKAANQGCAEAQCNLALCYYLGTGVTKDYKITVEWLTKAATQGYAEAQCNLAMCYEHGIGTPQSDKKAVEWYTKAANQGHAQAQCNLATCYYFGTGVTKNYKKAVEWYTKAANQGYAEAQFNLAMCYEEGTGVLKDMALALKWYTDAANQGYADAQDKLRDFHLDA